MFIRQEPVIAHLTMEKDPFSFLVSTFHVDLWLLHKIVQDQIKNHISSQAHPVCPRCNKTARLISIYCLCWTSVESDQHLAGLWPPLLKWPNALEIYGVKIFVAKDWGLTS